MLSLCLSKTHLHTNALRRTPHTGSQPIIMITTGLSNAFLCATEKKKQQQRTAAPTRSRLIPPAQSTDAVLHYLREAKRGVTLETSQHSSRRREREASPAAGGVDPLLHITGVCASKHKSNTSAGGGCCTKLWLRSFNEAKNRATSHSENWVSRSPERWQ